MYKTAFLIFIFLYLNALTAIGQNDTILLKNPSFEGIPKTTLLPKGWTNCNEDAMIMPDIHPSGVYGVEKRAINGDTYIALLADKKEGQEKIGQLLSSPISADQCYFFKLSICKTNHYKSATRKGVMEGDYNEPIKLTIWGANEMCIKSEKLAESKVIYNTNWQDFVFTFQPTKNYTHLIIETAYDDPLSLPYNGHVLIDNASTIFSMPCDSLDKWTNNDPDNIANYFLDNQNFILHEETLNSSNNNSSKAIYYNHNLTTNEQEKAILAIQKFGKRYPKQKANVIIEEPTKKQGKAAKKELIKALEELGVNAATYAIYVYRGSF